LWTKDDLGDGGLDGGGTVREDYRFPSAEGKFWRLGYHFGGPSKGGELSVEVAGAWGKGMVFIFLKLACGAVGEIVCVVCEEMDPLSERVVSLLVVFCQFLDFVGGFCLLLVQAIDGEARSDGAFGVVDGVYGWGVQGLAG
jgi:hypothetical protein